MKASEMQEGRGYLATHKDIGDGFARRIGNSYYFWDEDGKNKGLVNGNELCKIVLVQDLKPEVGKNDYLS